MIWERMREPSGAPPQSHLRNAGAKSSEHADGNHGWERRQGPDRHADNCGAGEQKRSDSVAVLLRVDLDTVTKDKVHDLIKAHKCALEKLTVVKGDAHTVGRHQTRGGGRGPEEREERSWRCEGVALTGKGAPLGRIGSKPEVPARVKADVKRGQGWPRGSRRRQGRWRREWQKTKEQGGHMQPGRTRYPRQPLGRSPRVLHAEGPMHGGREGQSPRSARQRLLGAVPSAMC